MQKVVRPKDMREYVSMSLFVRNALVYNHSKSVGLELAKYYSFHFRVVVESIYHTLAESYADVRAVVAIYGSAARQEMAAHSDADVLVITYSESRREKEYRKAFQELLEPFGFAKIDIPDWGSVEQLEIIARENIVEGNQILEAEVVAGDYRLIKKFEAMQARTNTLERQMRNIIFQLYCYEYYYQTRRKPGYINIKYSDGGTRDTLFFIWLAQLEAKWRTDTPPKRTIDSSFEYLTEVNALSYVSARQIKDAISLIILVRSEVLRQNQSGKHMGLSLFKLDDHSIYDRSAVLTRLFSSHEEFIVSYRLSAALICRVKKILIKRAITNFFPANLSKNIIAIKDTRSLQAILRRLSVAQPSLVRLASIWELTKRCMKSNLSDQRIGELVNTNSISWEEMASIVCSPLIDASLLDDFARRIIRKTGYGYILKMIAQHKNTSRGTLMFIANNADSSRYQHLARVSLSKGHKATNFQV